MAYRKLTVRWNLTGDDDRMTSWFFNTGANSDAEDDCEAAFDAAWTALKPAYHPTCILSEYRWYFSATLVPRGAPWGDADRTIDRNVPGTSPSPALPPQCSIVVSYLRPSPLRRHGGRNYLPAPDTNQLTGAGRISAASIGAFADRMETFLEACVAVGYQPITIARVQGVDTALIVPTLRVDDVVDTQRRRGFENFTSVAERTLTTVP